MKMKNPLHKFLDMKFKLVEGVLLIFVLLGIGTIVAYVFGETTRTILGFIFLGVGVYGFIRAYVKEKKKKSGKK